MVSVAVPEIVVLSVLENRVIVVWPLLNSAVGAVPSPVPVTVTVALGAFAVLIVIVPVTTPSATGMNRTPKVQVLPGATAVRTVLLQLSFPGSIVKAAVLLLTSGAMVAGKPVKLVMV